MTLLEIRNQLFTHFCEKDTFSTEEFAKIKIAKELEGNRDAIIRTALAEMVEMGVSKPVVNDLWILSSPVSGAGQSVQLSMRISDAIAGTIETFLKANEVEFEEIDKFNLHEGHIWQLLGIINDLTESDKD
jgi:predicted naringenin-chalcone synthase